MRNFVSAGDSCDESFEEVGVSTMSVVDFRSSARENSNLAKSLAERGEPFFSFELFPVEEENLYKRFFDRMKKFSPLFYALTWRNEKVNNKYVSLRLVERFPENTLLHLAAGCLNKTEVEFILQKAFAAGVTNIFALRGDCVSTDTSFPHAADLVEFIRKRFGDKFSICVAGYPETHPESISRELDLFHLKAKVDAGADFVITQIFFESRTFIDFVKSCREIGIRVPIIPGIFPIPSYECLERMSKICKIRVPEKILDLLEPLRGNEEAVKNFGVQLATDLIREIFESGASRGFHLFTLNRTTLATEICDRVFA